MRLAYFDDVCSKCNYFVYTYNTRLTSNRNITRIYITVRTVTTFRASCYILSLPQTGDERLYIIASLKCKTNILIEWCFTRKKQYLSYILMIKMKWKININIKKDKMKNRMGNMDFRVNELRLPLKIRRGG